MMLLLGFDLPRNTPLERKQAVAYRKHLIELGFVMKQYSLYEREVQCENTRKNLIAALTKALPDTGRITLYLLPDKVNNSQIMILGKSVPRKSSNKPKFIII